MLDKYSREQIFSKDMVIGSVILGTLCGALTMLGVGIARIAFYLPEYSPPTARVSGENGIRSVTLGPVPKNVETNGYQGTVNFDQGEKLLQTLAQTPQTVLSVEQAGQAAFAYAKSFNQRYEIAKSGAFVNSLKWGGIVGAAAGFGLFGLAAIREIPNTRSRRAEQQSDMAR